MRAISTGLLLCLGIGATLAVVRPDLVHAARLRVTGRSTVAERVEKHGPAARARLAPHLAAAGIDGTPASITLVAFKDQRVLELWAAPVDGAPRLVRRYDVTAASGGLGPKLREGDRQVPEGVYAIESLNPNSRFHLSLRVDYPSAADRARAREDGRDEAGLGSDIMIHGGSSSVGCVAVGDPAIEELFVLVADVGVECVRVLLVPTDLRVRSVGTEERSAESRPLPWVDARYAELRSALQSLESASVGGR